MLVIWRFRVEIEKVEEFHKEREREREESVGVGELEL